MLLVDDNKDIAEAICFYSHSKDIDCDCINEGKKALESIQREKYDLILLDLAMPGFSGLDVISSLQEHGGIESKNIVVFTASSARSVMDKIKDSGIKEILKKPCSLDDLTNLIERYRPRQ
jgi:two-component system OmpR family response regulator